MDEAPRTVASAPADTGRSLLVPLRHAPFRRVWLASLLSNLGLLIQGVGAAWTMTELTDSATMVALVQTAITLPILLISVPAGAVADMYDRRSVAIGALCVSLAGAVALFALAAIGAIGPLLLLAFCFVIGSGMALFGPAWQASVSEQVPTEALPSAVALNSISYNIARSFGPAIGGMIVAAGGAVATFGTNALLYLPMLAVLLRSPRLREPSRLPPERIGRAIVSGWRYVFHSPPLRIVLLRVGLVGLMGGSLLALMPLIARDLLRGGPGMFGLMLGAFGLGAVLGAVAVTTVRRRFGSERAISGCALAIGGAMIMVGFSRNQAMTALILMIAGVAWLTGNTLFNIIIQMSVPRWVAGRALAAYQASLAGGIAIGSWGWGMLAQQAGVATALYVAGTGMAASALLGRWLRMPGDNQVPDVAPLLADPEVRLGITGRSGPIVIEIEYCIAAEAARTFYGLMQEVQSMRQRNGAYGWSIARDIADPELWTERYHCPTWHDYLRQRDRATASEHLVLTRAAAFHRGEGAVRVRRMLERPFGSVRWTDQAPDRGIVDAYALAPQGGGA